jgi:hypothetical protein
MFLKNDRQLGVMNGSLGTVREIEGRDLLVRLDNGRELVFDANDYNTLRHGYAATVHKEQGVTVDRVHVLAGKTFDQQLAYVAMSRHREAAELHWSRETFESEEKMREALSREGRKDMAIDHEKEPEQPKVEPRVERKREAQLDEQHDRAPAPPPQLDAKQQAAKWLARGRPTPAELGRTDERPEPPAQPEPKPPQLSPEEAYRAEIQRRAAAIRQEREQDRGHEKQPEKEQQSQRLTFKKDPSEHEL